LIEFSGFVSRCILKIKQKRSLAFEMPVDLKEALAKHCTLAFEMPVDLKEALAFIRPLNIA
jgi:hypothetical protein